MKLFGFKALSDFAANHTRYSFAILLIFSILFMLTWGSLKSPANFHVDEIWQYSYANSYGKATNVIEKEDFQKWLPASIFRDYITVQPDEKFSFAKIVESSKYDVHPPLSHFLINIVSSFFTNNFSKWFGLSINIASYALTICSLYCLSTMLVASKSRALVATALWAFSLGAINTVMYIRMYCLLTLFSVTLVLFSVKYMQSREKKFLFLTFGTFILGGLTDYIFWIFGFFVTLAFVLVQWKRSARASIKFAIISFCSFVTTCILFPTTVIQLIDQESITSKATDTFGVTDQLRRFFDVGYVITRFVIYSSDQVFFVSAWIIEDLVSIAYLLLIFCIIILFIICIYSTLLSEASTGDKEVFPKDPVIINEVMLTKTKKVVPKAVVLFLTTLKKAILLVPTALLSKPLVTFVALAVFLCTYTIATIFPDFQIWSVRAFFYLFPFFSILVASILFFVHDRLKVPAGVLSLVIFILLVRSYVVATPPFLFRDGYEKLDAKIEQSNVIFLLDHEDSTMRLPNFAPSLAGANSVYVLPINNENYRQELAAALDTVGTRAKTMVISLIGSSPANDFARGMLGPEFLLNSDPVLVSTLEKKGYRIDVKATHKHLFQWFHLYEILPSVKAGDNS